MQYFADTNFLFQFRKLFENSSLWETLFNIAIETRSGSFSLKILNFLAGLLHIIQKGWGGLGTVLSLVLRILTKREG
jgi:hypothetical protein